jgi:BASS family bile acid:Na+ symporter
MSSNVMTYLVRGDVAYSVSLTTVSTLLAPLLTPSLTFILASTFVHVDFLGLFFSIIQTVILPLIIGIYLRHQFSEYVRKALKVFPAISVLAIVLICAVVVALNEERISNTSLILFSAVLLLNAVGYLGGYYGGKVLRQEPRHCRTLSIEIGMQNAGLGMVLALAHFSEEVALPSALFCIWCIITTSILVRIWTARDNRVEH